VKAMRRLLLLSTAVFGLSALSALAQQTDQAQQPAAQPDAGGAPAAGAEAPKPIPEQAEHQVRAQTLLGVDVTNGQDTIGDVSDLVVTEEGQVEAIVVGIGGFLGIGEKWVALDWHTVKLTEQNGSRVFVVKATREQLEAMPEFKTLEQKEAEAAAANPQLQQQGVAPATAPGAVPGAAAPGAVPSTAPEAAPGAAPGALPGVTPDAAPDASGNQ